jgi:hypothetical protein
MVQQPAKTVGYNVYIGYINQAHFAAKKNQLSISGI